MKEPTKGISNIECRTAEGIVVLQKELIDESVIVIDNQIDVV